MSVMNYEYHDFNEHNAYILMIQMNTNDMNTTMQMTSTPWYHAQNSATCTWPGPPRWVHLQLYTLRFVCFARSWLFLIGYHPRQVAGDISPPDPSRHGPGCRTHLRFAESGLCMSEVLQDSFRKICGSRWGQADQSLVVTCQTIPKSLAFWNFGTVWLMIPP